MYQSYVYLEVRVLLSAVPGVFTIVEPEDAKRDILSAKAEFQEKNNSQLKVNNVTIQPSALHKVLTLARAMGSNLLSESLVEHLTGNIQEPPDDKNFTGFSVKVAQGGSFDIMFHQKAKKIAIEEVRIEEDCGHLTRSGGKKAHLDWTYAGCPVLRLKTSAVFEVGEEVEIFLHELYTIMAYLKLLNPEQGESCVRCNAYVALAEYPLKSNYIVKLRNLNSFNFARKAVNSELSRQESILSSGGSVKSESRLWLEEQNTTESFKTRQPDITRFESVGCVVSLKNTYGDSNLSVELPSVRRNRLRSQYGLSRLRTQFICAEKDRADYFESVVAMGADPMLSAHWMASEFMRLLNMYHNSIKMCALTCDKYACIMKMLKEGKLHSGMVKTLMQKVYETGLDPEYIMKNEGMELLSTREELMPYIEKVLSENAKSVRSLQMGEMSPLEFLTGCVMKETGGRSVPSVVKSLIKEYLKISVVYVLTMGGAITAQKLPDGTVAAGNPESIRNIIGNKNNEFPVQISPVVDMLSEETEPADWAKLVEQVMSRIQSGTANGIVITHGTDTLCYTAALMFWLFSSANVPVVLTASSTLPVEGDEARSNLELAIETAKEKKNGVYVVYGGKILSALNLKYISSNKNGFVNWNLTKPVYISEGFISQQFLTVPLPESDVMTRLLNEASSRLSVVRLFPGLPGYMLERNILNEGGCDNIILELYSSGTGSMRNSDYSLKPLLINGRKKGCHFYCTSQQECRVDFSEYSTSARVWREGAVPMGALTTESVIALYFASYLMADNDNELSDMMESASESLGL